MVNGGWSNLEIAKLIDYKEHHERNPVNTLFYITKISGKEYDSDYMSRDHTLSRFITIKRFGQKSLLDDE